MDNTSRVSESFREGSCAVCRCNDVNRYFSIKESLVDYNGEIISYREIISESLDFDIDEIYETSLELCWDCKDSILKFFHFRRKIKQVQSRRATGLHKKQTPSTNRGEHSRHTTTTSQATETTIKSEPVSEAEESNFDDHFELFDAAVEIKEEPEEQPIVQHTYATFEPSIKPSRAQTSKRGKRGLPESQISYGAQKMRDFRARLKQPENRMQLIRQKELQRQWNRKAYEKRQSENGLPIRPRRSRRSRYEFEVDSDFSNM